MRNDEGKLFGLWCVMSSGALQEQHSQNGAKDERKFKYTICVNCEQEKCWEIMVLCVVNNVYERRFCLSDDNGKTIIDKVVMVFDNGISEE